MTTETEMQTDLAVRVQRVSELSSELTTATPINEVLNVIGLFGEAKAVLAEMQKAAEEIAVEILKRDGEATIGTVRWWAGVSKTTKCKSLKAAAEMIFQASGGDWDKFVDCLSSDAIKHGAAKKLFIEAKMPEKYEQAFETKEKGKLESDAPKKTLQKLDSKYLK